ncbi:MAG: hypothetical protein C0404_09705 [Verrucomicrobia bacterium]|nr:hypothetical protein [Verrucomicrobiota bacterium]
MMKILNAIAKAGRGPWTATLCGVIVLALTPLPGIAQQMPQDNWYFERAWGTYGTNNGQFSSPTGVAIGPDGRVYVVDKDNNRIQVFEKSGVFVRKWGVSGSGDGQFNQPRGVAIGTNGLVYVADACNYRIQVFQTNGVFVRKWGGDGSGDGQFNQPNGVAIGTNGLVYVADTYNDRIQVFTADGTFMGKWGATGAAPGLLKYPFDIAIGLDGLAYVADTSNNRIQVFLAKDGTFVRLWFSNAPYSTCVISDNLIAVICVNNISIFTSDGALVRSIGGGGMSSQFGLFNYADSMCCDSDGTLYVAESGNKRIQVFPRGMRNIAASAPDSLPQPRVNSVEQRGGVPYVDIDYEVKDTDSSNVCVAALAFVNGSNSLNQLLKLNTLIEGTATNVGPNITANQPHRLTWNAAADWSTNFGQVKIEVLANDGRGLLDFHFLDIPSNGPDPELKIDRYPLQQKDFLSCWYWLIATNDPAVRLENGMVYEQLTATNVPSPTNGLMGTYYTEDGLYGSPTQRIDSSIQFAAGIWQPSWIGSSNFSVRWTGSVVPLCSEPYTFYTYAHKGARLWIDGQQITTDWDTSSEQSGSISLVAGRPFDLTMEFHHNSMPATNNFDQSCYLKWSSPSTPKDVIPGYCLFTASQPTGTMVRLLANGTTTTQLGREFLFNRLGVREATPSEIARAKLASSAGMTNSWPTRIYGDPRTNVNEYGFSTYNWGANAWYVVKP